MITTLVIFGEFRMDCVAAFEDVKAHLGLLEMFDDYTDESKHPFDTWYSWDLNWAPTLSEINEVENIKSVGCSAITVERLK